MTVFLELIETAVAGGLACLVFECLKMLIRDDDMDDGYGEALRIIESWNEEVSVGDFVRFYPDADSNRWFGTRTTSAACIINSEPVVKIACSPGFVSLRNIRNEEGKENQERAEPAGGHHRRH